MSDNMLGNALAAVAGPLNDFFQKLSGTDGTIWLTAFKRFLRKENPWPKFAVRWTVTLGLLKTPEAYVEAIGKKNVTRYTHNILKKITCSKRQVEVHLTYASFAEVGLTKGGTLEEFLDAVKLSGGTKCPAEVGFALRLLYKEQPQFKSLMILMDPISGTQYPPFVFYLDSYADGLILDVSSGPLGGRFNADERVVFAVPLHVS